MHKITLISIIGAVLLCGCANESATVAKDGYIISHVRIAKNGETEKSRPDMAGICKGFILSKQQIRTFFVYADRVNVNILKHSYKRLPCYASGTAIINNKPYNWIIKSGGIGKFTGKNRQFLKICGKGCCNKTPGVC